MSRSSDVAAFPSDTVNYGPQCGMSLRDYFAAKAMSAIICKAIDSACIGQVSAAVDEACKASYKIADAMLAERAK